MIRFREPKGSALRDEIGVPRLWRSDYLRLVTQSFRAGLTFSGWPSGPRRITRLGVPRILWSRDLRASGRPLRVAFAWVPISRSFFARYGAPVGRVPSRSATRAGGRRVRR